MKARRASRTAELMALFRALESGRPSKIRLFHDPYAIRFLGASLRMLVWLSYLPLVGRLVPWLVDLRSPGARSSGVARTRLIDDLVTQALRDGLDQVVILGAGFDCRDLRLPGIENARVFELDHPDTLAVKREQVRKLWGSLPVHVQFMEIDFNRQRLDEVLAASHLDQARPNIVIWEGVTNYLTEGAVDATLAVIGTMAPGSRVIFTYVHRDALDESADFYGINRLTRDLRRLGEPWTFGLYPEQLPEYLAAHGLRLIEDLGSTEYRKRYMAPRPANMRGYEFYRVAVARVIPKVS
jgi:methyltransferase (TIGR00027 family)